MEVLVLDGGVGGGGLIEGFVLGRGLGIIPGVLLGVGIIIESVAGGGAGS